MTAKDFINPGFLPLRTSDTALTALSWMDEYRVSHLPVVNGIDYLGLISDSDIYNDADLDEPIGNHSLSLNHPFVEQNQHIYDVLKIMASLKLTLLPVLDDKNHYLGVITQGILIDEISNITSIQNPGATLVLEVSSNNYSLSEIAQIVESNDAKILSCFITSQPDSTEMDVTIRINRMDFYPILQTFNRYNYVVKASYGESNYYEDLQERYDMLMNYLNV
jgi:FOG: CBS domain